jgi:hypothetical protein
MDDQDPETRAAAQSAANANQENFEARIDWNLEDSFPASDPPEWVLGVERNDRLRPRKSSR